MPKNWVCHGNYKSVKLHYVHLYGTLHLEIFMAAHFQRGTETRPPTIQARVPDCTHSVTDRQ